LSEEEQTEFKDFFEGTLDGVADQIADELKNHGTDQAALLSKLKSVYSLRTALVADKRKPYLADFIVARKLPNLQLAETDSDAVADALFRCGANGLGKRAELIQKDMFPNLSLEGR
jgi:hypothetical protein